MATRAFVTPASVTSTRPFFSYIASVVGYCPIVQASSTCVSRGTGGTGAMSFASAASIAIFTASVRAFCAACSACTAAVRVCSAACAASASRL